MPNTSNIRDSILERSGQVSPLDILTQEVYEALCTWMQTVQAEQRVAKLCDRVFAAFSVPGGSDELLSSEPGGLYVGLQRLYKEYKVFTSNQTELYDQAFPYCKDHLTMVLLEQGVEDERHALLLQHYLLGDVDHTEEAWRNLDNCPKRCGSLRCYKMSPKHKYCSVGCEEKAAEERANAASAAK